MTYDICMVVHNDVLNDSRIWREARTLNSQGWEIVVVCIALGNSELPAIQEVDGFTIWRVKPFLFKNRSNLKSAGKFFQLITALPLALWRIRQSQAKVFHSHDFVGLLITAMAGIRQRPVIYDSHELFFDRRFRGVPRWMVSLLMLLRPLEKVLAHKAAAIIATSDGHADQLVRNLNITRPIVVRNAVDLSNLKDQAIDYPRNNRRLVVHSGSLLDGRHLPELIQALSHLSQDIALILMGDGPLKARLKESAEKLGVADRLVVLSPVPPDNVALTLAQADIGVVLITGDSLSYKYSLPNKFFETVAAGLPLVVSEIPELSRMVTEYDLGLICEPTDPEDIAQKVEYLLREDNLERYRNKVEEARRVLNWQNEEKKLILIYENLL